MHCRAERISRLFTACYLHTHKYIHMYHDKNIKYVYIYIYATVKSRMDIYIYIYIYIYIISLDFIPLYIIK